MDPVAIANLIFTMITTMCALYLSFVALRHSARPRIDARMITPRSLACGKEYNFVLELGNIGHWYAKPTAINVVVFCNFDPHFTPIDIAYGSVQAYKDKWVGKARMKYLKAKGIKLAYGEEWEAIHVRAITPKDAGNYIIRISAYSDNGASLVREFRINCAPTMEASNTEAVEIDKITP